jgi:hypothetical protein
MDAGTLAAILAIPASTVGIFTWVKRYASFMSRLEDTLKPDAEGRSISERLDMTQNVVAEIKKQVFPNGGNSLRDAVNDAAVLAKAANDAAVLASVSAQEAAARADRSEIMGNFERREMRKKLDDIDTKIGTSAGVLTDHLVEAAKATAEIKGRIDNIEKRSA